jgi:hypothetical protein
MTRNDSDDVLATARDTLDRHAPQAQKRTRALTLLATRLAYARAARAAGRPLGRVMPETGPGKPN